MKVQIVGEGRAVALLLPSRGEGLHPALASVVLPSGCALVVVSFVTIRVASPTDDDLERVEDLVFNHECAGVIAYSGASRIALGGLQAALPTVCLGGDALPLTLPGGGRPHLIYGDQDPVMAKNQRPNRRRRIGESARNGVALARFETLRRPTRTARSRTRFARAKA